MCNVYIYMCLLHLEYVLNCNRFSVKITISTIINVLLICVCIFTFKIRHINA